MSIEKDKALLDLFHQLPEYKQKSAFDFMQNLVQRDPILKDYYDNLPEVDEPLSAEEHRQMNSKEGFMTREEAKREFGLNLP